VIDSFAPPDCASEGSKFLVNSVGCRLYVHEIEGRLLVRGAFYDAAFCITSCSIIKSYFVIGDLRKGVHFVMFRSDGARSRSFRRLSRSYPATAMPVLAVEGIVASSSLGMLASDLSGNVHLCVFTPSGAANESGETEVSLKTSARHNVRSCISNFVRHSIDAITVGAIGGTVKGSLLLFRPISEADWKLISAVQSRLDSELPYRLGCNPEAGSCANGMEGLPPVDSKHGIADVNLLRLCCYLSTPIRELCFESPDMVRQNDEVTSVLEAVCDIISTGLYTRQDNKTKK